MCRVNLCTVLTVVTSILVIVGHSAEAYKIKNSVLPPKIDDYSDDIIEEDKTISHSKKSGYGDDYGGSKEIVKEEEEESGYDGPKYGGYDFGAPKETVKTEEIVKEESGYGGHKSGGYGYGGPKKVIKTEEIIKEESGYGGPGLKTEEVVEESGYGAPKKIVKTEEIVKKESGYGGHKSGGYGYGSPKKVIKTEEIIKEESGYGGQKSGGYGYGSPKKVVKTEEIVKEESGYGGPGLKTEEVVVESGYGGQKSGGYGYGGPKKLIKTEEIIKEESGYGGGGKSGGYGKGGDVVKAPIIDDAAFGGSGGKSGYGGGGKAIKTEEIIKEESGYGKGGEESEIKTEEFLDESAYRGGNRGGYGGGGGKKAFKTEESGYGAAPKVPEYGGEDKEIGQDGYNSKIDEDDDNEEKTVIKSETTHILKPPQCNKLIDGWLGSLQPTFVQRMSHYSLPKMAPIRLGSWAKISMYDGKLDGFGEICRQGDFRMYDNGDELIMDGIIAVPEPRAKYCSDAYLYNRIKIRNRFVRLAAKEASFKVKVHINKRTRKVLVDQLEPVALNGFHLEDAHSTSGALVWPFTKIGQRDLIKHKLQFMGTLTNELCDQFRTMVYQPEYQRSLIKQVY